MSHRLAHARGSGKRNGRLFSRPRSGYVGSEPMSDGVRWYVIGLGANLGDRRATLRSAVLTLGAQVVGVSHLYETAAVGPPQPAYLNAALLLESALAPAELLAELLAVERAHGRERRERWGPRTLDLDVLHSEGLVVDEPGLVLPHPQLHVRPFALRPLLDVAPEAHDARSGERYAALLRVLDTSDLRRLETSETWDPREPASGAPTRTE